MKVNMLEAKDRLSRLVKQALDGEDVIIASNGEPMVRLVPDRRKGRSARIGPVEAPSAGIDDAFTLKSTPRSPDGCRTGREAAARHPDRSVVADGEPAAVEGIARTGGHSHCELSVAGIWEVAIEHRLGSSPCPLGAFATKCSRPERSFCR